MLEKKSQIAGVKLNWLVYIIEADDESLYTGITTDIERRFIQHKTGKGAKYFYGRAPVKIVFLEDGHTRSSASKREAEIRRLPKHKKLLLVKKTPETLNGLNKKLAILAKDDLTESHSISA